MAELESKVFIFADKANYSIVMFIYREKNRANVLYSVDRYIQAKKSIKID